MGMASDDKLRETFSKLRPICVLIAEEPSEVNLQALQKALDLVDPSAVNDLQEYVLFPLRVLLKQPRESKSENVFLETVACVHKVISRVDSLSEFSVFTDFFSGLCCLLSTRDASISVAPVCEELKLTTVQCLSELIRKLPFNLLGRVYSPSFLPCLGHAVTVLLCLAQQESLRKLRAEAMICLTELMLVKRDAPDELKVMCGGAFASFLPGIATGLYRVITGDTKQGQQVTCVAISGWASAVVLVLGDSDLATAADDDVSDCFDSLKMTEDSRNLSVRRSSEWTTTTVERLKVMIDRMASVANHLHWKVRLEMIKFADELLTKCSKSLACSVIQLLNILVQGRQDEYPDVAASGSAALTSFHERQIVCGNQSLIEILEENIFCLATQLPRKIMGPSDADKLNALKLFCGYLVLLSQRIDVVLTSDVHLRRTSQALMQVLEFETSSLLIVEDRDSEMFLSQHELSMRPFYQFKHFNAIEVKDEIVKICRLFGEQGNFLILIDHFMELFRHSRHYRKQAIFCIGEILLGAKNNLFQRYSESEAEMLIRSVLDEFLLPDFWNLPLENSTEAKSDLCRVSQLRSSNSVHSFNELNDNILQTCLLIDCIGCCACAFDSHFGVHLIEVIYPILEKVGSDNIHVSQRAVGCALQIAKACSCSDIAGLIRSAMDYLLNAVMLRWRHLHGNPQVLDVLRVMFQFSDETVLPLLSGTIHKMCNVLDLHSEEFGTQFLKVFHAMVGSLAKCFGPSGYQNNDLTLELEDCENLKVNRQKLPMTAEDVNQFFTDYCNQKKILENMDKSDEPNDGHSSEVNVDDGINSEPTDSETGSDAKDLPFYVELLKLVLDRCRHFLIRPESHNRLLALEIIGQSCVVLKPHQDELLPLVHKIWTPFVQRFSDSDPVVAMKAFDTLRLVVFAAKDFLRRRVTDDILPRVVTVLKTMSESSLKAGPAYKYSMSCKLQLCILNQLGYFCRCVDIKGHHLNKLQHACFPYLCTRQPLCLQQASTTAFKCFLKIDPDNAWLMLNNVCCRTTFEPPSGVFHPVDKDFKFEYAEYTDNIIELIKLI